MSAGGADPAPNIGKERECERVKGIAKRRFAGPINPLFAFLSAQHAVVGTALFSVVVMHH